VRLGRRQARRVARAGEVTLRVTARELRRFGRRSEATFTLLT
jgi:hypothetical protein